MSLLPSPFAPRVVGLFALLLAGCVPAAGPPRPGDEVGIPEIQGRSHYSPLTGRRVRSSGIVTSVSSGVATVQDPVGDGDLATSDAVMLRLGDLPLPRVGDRIRFGGEVRETVPGGEKTANLSVTTVVLTELRVEGAGPTPVPRRIGGDRLPRGKWVISPDELPVNLRDPLAARANRYDPDQDAIDFLESLEGMRVTIASPVAVSAIQVFGRDAAEVTVLPDGGSRIAAERRTVAGGILLQSGPDNRGSQNPERIQIQLDSTLVPGAFPAISVGDRLDAVTGVVRYDFGNYEVAATEPLRVRRGERRPARARPASLDGRLAFASYNVLNLGGGPEDSVQRVLLGRQIAGALGSPAILALQEIQDDSGERDDGTTSAGRTLALLALAVRAAGGPAYGWLDVPPADGRQGGAPGGNIRNAFLYDSTQVRLIRFASLTPALLAAAGASDPRAFRASRDPLMAVFEARGRRITFINNHLTSRYGSTPTYGSVQPFVQAGEAERAAQVRDLNAYVRWMLAAEPGNALVVLGDMNTFEFTDDLATLLPGAPPVLHPLSGLVPAGERYSYNYEGNSQVLDHVFVTGALRNGAEVRYVHLNTDAPAMPGATPSDHDPVLARVRW